MDYIQIEAGMHVGRFQDPIGLDGVNHIMEHVAAKASKLSDYKNKMELLGVNFSLGTVNNLRTWMNLTVPNTTKHGHTSQQFIWKNALI